MPLAAALDAVLLSRIRGEYREMPGLSLTFGQACRLWQVDSATCEPLLKQLVEEGFLVRSLSGAYAARGAAAMAWPRRRSSNTTAA